MSEADAVRHICENTDFDDTEARRDLHGRVMDSDVEARARRAEFKPVDVSEGRDWLRSRLSLSVWLHSILEWTGDRILISVDTQKEVTGRPTGRIIATGIEFRRGDVHRLWPAQESEKVDSKPIAAPNKGGRPPKYDREEINAFVIAYIVENGKTPIAEVVRELQATFETDAKPLPDRRTLERIVSKSFKRLEKLEQSRGGKT